jgi:hypothetical protein
MRTDRSLPCHRGPMFESSSLVGAGDRVALLRHGIVVVGAEVAAGRLQLAVTGADPARVHDIIDRELGAAVAVEVLGDTPRQIEPRQLRGHMEREAGRLQVRLQLCGDEHVDEIVVAEDDRSVVVFATVCAAVAGDEGDTCEVPHHLYLKAPLGDRTVIDGSTGDAVPYKNIWKEIERRRGLASPG